MPKLSFQFGDNGDVEAPFERSLQRGATRVKKSLQGAITDAASEIKSRGQQDILGAGANFTEIAQRLEVALTQGGGNYRLSVSDSHPWFWVNERGALIQGNPLLWIPLSSSGVPKNTLARNYPGRLFRVDRKSGPPILMDAADKQGKYVGIQSVTIKKKFHIEEIIQDVASKMNSFYRQKFQEASNG